MPFSSVFFLIGFLPVVLLIYSSLRKVVFKNIFLVLASLSFYASGEGSYIALIVLSIAGNYCIGRLIDSHPGGHANPDWASRRRLVFSAGLVFNLALLGYFKYSSFVSTNVNAITGYLGLHPLHLGAVHLPLAISFLTFHAISYLVDIYRGIARSQRDPLKLALYFVFFPHMIAGPIVRYNHIEHQLSSRAENATRFAYGAQRFILGLGKKVLIADILSPIVDQIFSLSASELSMGSAWLGACCYALQIFFDFSGYSDMAIGLAHMFGFHFPENFNNPYWASSITDFWRRWHVTLSNWFRDYLYILLGGNRGPRWRTLLNLLVVFFLCGLWHGAAWTFVAWGMLHGTFLIIERLVKKRGSRDLKQPTLLSAVLRHIYVIAVLLVSWVLFRSANLSYGLSYVSVMLGFSPFHPDAVPTAAYLSRSGAIALIAGLSLASPLGSIAWAMFRRVGDNLTGRVRQAGKLAVEAGYLCAFAAILILCLSRLSGGATNPFIYFRF